MGGFIWDVMLCIFRRMGGMGKVIRGGRVKFRFRVFRFCGGKVVGVLV